MRPRAPARRPTPVQSRDLLSLFPDLHLESRAFVQQLLDALDDDKRAVLVLYEIEGLSMREVAEVVGCPLQTAYSRLHAGRELLRAAWEATEQEGK